MRRLLCSVSLLLGLLVGLLGVPASAQEAFPGSNGLIAFSTTRDGNSEIYVVNADGSEPVNLTDHPGADAYPTWSADGTQIVFQSTRDGNREIYVMAADGTGQTNLTNHPGDDYQPTISPNGNLIAFDSDRSGDSDIWVMDADGSDPAPATDSPGADIAAAWSPDGNSIAFQSDRDGDYEIFVLPLDGSSEVQVTDNSAQDLFPAWSPDGSHLLFSSDRDGDMELYRMGADGSDPTRLSTSADPDFRPESSPDGMRIAFDSEREAPGVDTDLFVADADGSNPVNLTPGDANGLGPDWQPTSPPPPVYGTDGRIRLNNGALVGDGVYNATGVGQSRTGAAAPGRVINYYVSIQNEGDVEDGVRLDGGASSTRFRVQYLLGPVDVTTAITGAGLVMMLDPGGEDLLRIKVTVRNAAPRGASLTRLLTLTSQGDPAKADTVRFISRRSG